MNQENNSKITNSEYDTLVSNSLKNASAKEKSITLDELGRMLKISKERVRQIETKALEKLKIKILEISQQNKEFFI